MQEVGRSSVRTIAPRVYMCAVHASTLHPCQWGRVGSCVYTIADQWFIPYESDS